MTITIEQFLETYKQSVKSGSVKVLPELGEVKYGEESVGCFLLLFLLPFTLYFLEGGFLFKLAFYACMVLFLYSAFWAAGEQTVNIKNNTISKRRSKFYNVEYEVHKIDKIERQFVAPTENNKAPEIFYKVQFSGKAIYFYNIIGIRFTEKSNDLRIMRFLNTSKLSNSEEIRFTEIFLNIFSNKVNGNR